MDDKNKEKEKAIMYSDGNDYSDLEPNIEEYPDVEGCVMCGSDNITILHDKDICHEDNCRYVYT